MMMQNLTPISLAAFYICLALAIACYAIQAIRGKSVAPGHFFIGCMLCVAQIGMLQADFGISSAEGIPLVEAMADRVRDDSVNWFTFAMYFIPFVNAIMMFFMAAVWGQKTPTIPRYLSLAERLRWN